MLRKTLVAASLAALTVGTSAQALDLNNMTDAERADFGKAVREYLLSNPSVIMEAVEILRNNEAQAAAQQDLDLVQVNAEAIFNDGFSYVGGNPDGDITMVEFMDYRCGYCRKAFAEVEQLLNTDGNIKFIVKEFPILGEASVVTAQFAIAVKQLHGDDHYKSVHDALIAFTGDPTDAALSRIAESFGLDAGPILERMKTPEVNKVIDDTRALGARLQINGTPTFVLHDEMLRGYVPYDTMTQMVAAKRG